MSDSPSLSPEDYRSILDQYLRTHSEQALYQASLLSRECVRSGFGPEDVVALHMEVLGDLTADLSPREQIGALDDGQQFLLEMMIGYGVQYKEYLELKLVEAAREADQRVVFERERLLEAERIGRERAEILAVTAHELRTPITAARAHLELMDALLAGGQVEQVPQLLIPARDAVERLSRLTADLVEASRGEPPPLELTPTDLSRVLAQAGAWARPLAAGKGVNLHYPQDGQELWVAGSADALLSVVGNLISNAVRYTPAGGTVTIRQGTDEGGAWLAVEDTGIGMSEETQGRIFEKFYRGPEARQIDARGLGLGLALVKQLVDAHGGQIAVASTLGGGTTVRVWLPRADHASPLAD